ncbi:hypothetical protein PYCCODRAFT_1378128 [Trametes coccinea BRFM310]|uniref:Uncharacterized protein n=1 Tax=Trametes coccinea (strain BRFM310) TaxID=1353009 RepID=A0A1Y2I733_TRAC3|nr:hypothetical protein PYCCODRAFT_1378128 [Trametes coccinea BRFM310]
MAHTFASRPGERHYDTSDNRGDQNDSPVILHVPYVERPHVSPTSTTTHGFARRNSPSTEQVANVRYSPYPSPLSSTTPRYTHSVVHGLGSAETSPTMSRSPSGRATVHHIGETIKLPPIRPPAGRPSVDDGSFHLPPISSMDNFRDSQYDEPMAVLRRLQSSEELPHRSAVSEVSTQRRHSLVDPVYRLSDPSAHNTSVGVGARTDAGPRSPLSAAATSPSSSYPPLPRHSPSHPSHRSAVEHPEAAFSSAARTAPRDDRLIHSMPPSPYLHNRTRLDEQYRLQPQQERGISRHERPLSPPPSATSASSSPSDTVRTSWRPW